MVQFLAAEKDRLAKIGSEFYPEHFKSSQFLNFLRETIERDKSPLDKAAEIELHLKTAKSENPYLWSESAVLSTLFCYFVKLTLYRRKLIDLYFNKNKK